MASDILFCKKANVLNKTLKKQYYYNIIHENVGNRRQPLKSANEMSNEPSKTTKIDSTGAGDRKMTDWKMIRNFVNQYFSDIGNCLQEKIPFGKILYTFFTRTIV